MAFLEDSEDILMIREALKGVNIESSEVLQGGVKEAIETFASSRSPQYLIIDISNSDLPVSDLSKLAEVCEPGVIVLAVGLRDEVGLYRDLIKLGILEYLVRPLLPEIVDRALKKMIFGEEKEKTSHAKVGKIIVTMGARGGVGATFITTNFAAIIAAEKSRRAIVIDWDFHFGTVALYYNIKSNDGLKVSLESPERIDQLFLERLFNPVNERLFVLSSEQPLDEKVNYSALSIEQLLNYLSKLFHYVIVDVPHTFTDEVYAIMRRADMMLLVTDPTLAGLRDTGRIIRFFEGESLGRRLTLIMNNYVEHQKGKLSIDDFDKTLKYKISHVIPYVPLIATEFINQGKTLENQKNILADSIREIVNDVQGIKKTEKNTTFLDSFLNKIKFK